MYKTAHSQQRITWSKNVNSVEVKNIGLHCIVYKKSEKVWTHTFTHLSVQFLVVYFIMVLPKNLGSCIHSPFSWTCSINASSVQFSSVTQSCLSFCDPMDCSTPGFPVHHQLPELAQTLVQKSVMPSNHLILCRPLLLLPSIFPSIRVFSMSQLFVSGGQIIEASASASVLPMNIQDWFPLGWADWISSQFKGLSRVFSSTTVQKHQFFCAQLSLWSNSHIHTRLLEKP